MPSHRPSVAQIRRGRPSSVCGEACMTPVTVSPLGPASTAADGRGCPATTRQATSLGSICDSPPTGSFRNWVVASVPPSSASKHLKYLDLSGNDFRGIHIPRFMGSFPELRYLNLSASGFSGTVPHELGNLTSLRHLDVSSVNAGGDDSDDDFILGITLPSDYKLGVDDARWISRLTQLESLDMTALNLSRASNWLQALNMLPFIREISLRFCLLGSFPPSLEHVNFTSLISLDLSGNPFSSQLPNWLFNISSLEFLLLQNNQLFGPIPGSVANLISLRLLDMSYNEGLEGPLSRTMGRLCNLQSLLLTFANISTEMNDLGGILSGCMRKSLEELDLSGNSISGHLPDSLGNLKNLTYLGLTYTTLEGPIPASLGGLSSLRQLELAGNELNGTVPTSLGQLSELQTLLLRGNLLVDVLSEANFAKLNKLDTLDLSDNPSLVLNVSSNWVPPFRLSSISMNDCLLGPRFPAWLRTQENFATLEMSNAGISDAMPDWFWNLSSQVVYLDLSRNEIRGNLPETFVAPNALMFDLSNNAFSGPIPPKISEKMPILEYFSLSTNHIDGTIPQSMCQLTGVMALVLSNNHLSGELPNCFEYCSIMEVLDLSNNNLSGEIPGSVCSSSSFKSLHLSNNSLSGELPLPLKNCSGMVILDLAQNRFSGTIPTWVGESLTSLKILNVRLNNFSGAIPPQLSRREALQILDLSHNNLSATIPPSFGKFTAMKIAHIVGNLAVNESYYAESMLLNIKGRELDYHVGVLSLIRSIDLSENGLFGSIPVDIMNLHGLESLNLSANYLTGEIPQNIGGLQQLESLDLSRNKLSGEIPSTISTLYSLNHLNLSYNNLAGRIPSGYQLQTLTDPTIYMGNHDLCGLPLPRMCQGDETSPPPKSESGYANEDDEDVNDTIWFYVGIASGFVVGFWTVCGIMVLKGTWRIAYFRFMDVMYDRLYVVVSIYIARLTRKLF